MTPLSGYSIKPLFTVGETIGGYQPPGVLDGLSAYDNGDGTLQVLCHHEFNAESGYEYQLANGLSLTGSRISAFTIHTATRLIVDADLAFDRVFDRAGQLVVKARQINELPDNDPNSEIMGFDRFCSAAGYEAGMYGFVDDIHFANEESSAGSGHPHGGTVWALDVANGVLWACPALGRGAWENVTVLDLGVGLNRDWTAIALGEDSQSAPAYLWIGRKNALDDGTFTDRNGLAAGQLYVWVASDGSLTPEDFNGTGNAKRGNWMPFDILDKSMAGTPGYDDLGYPDDPTMREMADAMGAFSFSRPEDVHLNPKRGTQFAMASTGRGGLFPSDNWGTIYVVTNSITAGKLRNKLPIPAEFEIVYDGDDADKQDFGIRSPDNLVWSADGFLYVQEDRSTSPGSLFGGTSGREASIWKLDPNSSIATQIAEMDRSAVPVGQTDSAIGDIGNWESSGIIDASSLFGLKGGSLFFAVTQAHGINLGGDDLVQGGQLFILTK